MKRALLLLIGLMVLTNIIMPISCDVAKAVDLPYVVIGNELWLISNDSGQRLFLLPESYYARIDNIDDTFYYVTFNGVSGKVEKNLVSTIGYHTEADGTMQELRVDAKYSIFTEIKLKSTMEGSSIDIPVPVDGSLVFIGKYILTEQWYYVKYGDYYGYIKAEFTNKPDLDIAAFIPVVKPIELGDEELVDEKPADKNRVTKILVITGLSVVLIIILIVLFRPTRSSKHRYYYED